MTPRLRLKVRPVTSPGTYRDDPRLDDFQLVGFNLYRYHMKTFKKSTHDSLHANLEATSTRFFFGGKELHGSGKE